MAAERGVAGASVELVIARAQVSRRTFHKHFPGLPEALIAVLDEGYESAASFVAHAFSGNGTWVESMRSAMAAILVFFDSELAIARVCLVEAAAGDPLVREHLEGKVREFRTLVVTRLQDEISWSSPLAPEGALAAVMGVVRARLLEPQAPPLIELLGPLMGLLVAPFVSDAEVAGEVAAGEELARALLAGTSSEPAARARHAQAGVEVPLPLTHPSAFRLRECLLYVAGHAGASNSDVAAGLGIAHRGQTALLLRRLVSLGLLAKRSGAPGHANAWRATEAGEVIARIVNSSGTRPW